MEDLFVYSSPDKIDNLIQLILESNDDEVLKHIEENRRLRGLHQALNSTKNELLEECHHIYGEIQRLQEHSKVRQEKIKNINQVLERITPRLGQHNKVKSVKKEIPKKTIPQIKKRGLDEVEKDILSHNTDEENKKNRDKVVKMIKRVRNLKFDDLKSKEVFYQGDDSSNFESIKLMEKNVLRKRYDVKNPNHLKSFQRDLAIWKYLKDCDMVPPLLYYNPEKLTIYFPNMGKIPNKTPEISRKTSLMVRKLKRDWGVYRIKDNKIVSDLKPYQTLMDDKGKGYIIDFSSSGWEVDRGKTYPMKN